MKLPGTWEEAECTSISQGELHPPPRDAATTVTGHCTDTGVRLHGILGEDTFVFTMRTEGQVRAFCSIVK